MWAAAQTRQRPGHPTRLLTRILSVSPCRCRCSRRSGTRPPCHTGGEAAPTWAKCACGTRRRDLPVGLLSIRITGSEGVPAGGGEENSSSACVRAERRSQRGGQTQPGIFGGRSLTSELCCDDDRRAAQRAGVRVRQQRDG